MSCQLVLSAGAEWQRLIINKSGGIQVSQNYAIGRLNA